MNETPNTRRVTRCYSQHVAAEPERVFPLLCPVRERDWVDGWDADIVYSATGVAELGCVFTTPREGEADTIWTVSRYEPPRAIELVMVTPGSRVGLLRIGLEPEPGGTACTVEYTFTSLGPAGNAFVDAYTEDAYVAKMKGWERAINHYLATGLLLREA